MNWDDFEQQLRETPLRSPPAEWRGETLAAARRASRPRPVFLPGWLGEGLAEWLWPSPVAWAGLAATWAVIWALNTTGAMAAHSPELPVSFAGQWRAHQHMLAELLELAPWTEPTLPLPQPPRRSREPHGSSNITHHETAQMA